MDRKGGLMQSNIMVLRTNTLNRSITPILRLQQIITCGLLFKKSPVTILIGSIVPISNSELFKLEEQFAFNGESKSLGQKREVEFLKSIALKYLNAPLSGWWQKPFWCGCSRLYTNGF
jgi:hypothetical protein